jgi:hypothetical protein
MFGDYQIIFQLETNTRQLFTLFYAANLVVLKQFYIN